MEFLGILILAISMFGIIGLFALKSYEEREGRVLFPALRAEADVRALELKARLHEAQAKVGNVGPIMVRFTQILIHDAALIFAAFGNFLERKAHEVADRVSYKHRFERRESTSSFLRQVGEYKSHRLPATMRRAGERSE